MKASGSPPRTSPQKSKLVGRVVVAVYFTVLGAIGTIHELASHDVCRESLRVSGHTSLPSIHFHQIAFSRSHVISITVETVYYAHMPGLWRYNYVWHLRPFRDVEALPPR